LSASGLIAAERRRQVDAEGWTAKHDDQHRISELSLTLLLAYALMASRQVCNQKPLLRIFSTGRGTFSLEAVN
jgi:hypothetical protein